MSVSIREVIKMKQTEKVNQKSKEVVSLPTDLVSKLNSKEVNIVHKDDGRTRRKIVNWTDVLDWCISTEWINVKLLQEHVESTYDKKKLHYSEALRFIRSNKTNKFVSITIKEIQSGEHKGVYYNFIKKK